MDIIRFTIEGVYGKNLPRSQTVNIYINGRNLLNIIYWVERDIKLQIGEELGDSGYIGLPVSYLIDGPRAHFLEPRRDGEWKRWLLACTCSTPQCKGVLARITVYTDTVCWTDVQNPWLADPNPDRLSFYALKRWKPYDYSAIRSYSFDLKQYEQALEELEPWGRFYH